MTRTLHSSDSDTSSSHSSSKRRMRSLETPNVLAALEDTITLRDPNIVLPQRSLERHRRLQKLLQCYNTQLLHGCSSSNCTTRTCSSYRRRISKGPFRPYTLLSARTLATVLASQDHPERGLCPHVERDLKGDLLHQSRRLSASLDVTQRKNEGGRETPAPARDDDDGQFTTMPQPSDAVSSGSAKGRWPSLQNLHASIWGPSTKAESCEPLQPPDEAQTYKSKDPKSFTQNMFDTFAMRSLYDVMPRAPETNAAGSRSLGNSLQQEVVRESEDLSKPQRQVEKTESKLNSNDFLPTNNKGTLQNPSHLERNPRKKSATLPLSDTEGTDVETDGLSDDSTQTPPKVNQTDRDMLKLVPTTDRLQTRTETSDVSPDKGNSTASSDSGGTRLSPKTDSNQSLTTHAPIKMPEMVRPPHRTDHTISGNDMIFPYTAKSLRFLSHPLISEFIKKRKLRKLHMSKQQNLLQAFGRHQQTPCAYEAGGMNPKNDSEPLSFLTQSATYVCSSPEALLRSFLEHYSEESAALIATSSLSRICRSFQLLFDVGISRPTVLSGLWTGTEKLFSSRPSVKNRLDISSPTTRNLLTADHIDDNADELNDAEAAHIIKVTFAALNSTLPKLSPIEIEAVQKCRALGLTTPYALAQNKESDRESLQKVQRAIDGLEDDVAVSLATRLCKAISSRQYTSRTPIHRPALFIEGAEDELCRCSTFRTLVIRNLLDDDCLEQYYQRKDDFPSLRGGRLRRHATQEVIRVKRHQSGVALLVEWFRTVLLREWNSKAEIDRCSATDGALEMLGALYRHCARADLSANVFFTPILAQRLDYVEMPVRWANNDYDRSKLSVLCYPFLFHPAARISYFRAINHDTMNKCFEKCLVNNELLRRLTFPDATNRRGEVRVIDRLTPSLNKYLVLEIRRDYILVDAMNYLWRCHPSELMKPLKVRMGMDEGEEGIDHGGVQQEFFRIALAEALDPKYGAFTMDTQTRMSWIQPLSLEPLYKFELIGLLVGLAVYNGLTLPVTFPLALYSQLVGMPVSTIPMIEDGWPELAKGLKALQDWTDGDVAGVFLRTYTFSLDVFGSNIDVDMDARRRRARRSKLSKDKSNATSSDNLKNSRTSNVADAEPDAGYSSSEAAPFFEASSSRTLIASRFEDRKGQNGHYTSPPDRMPVAEDEGEGSAHVLNHRPDSPTPSTPMVTNANRKQYVDDYIRHLTYTSIAPQLDAFSSGFRRCLNRKSLSIFDPVTLQALVEGHENIDTKKLQAIATYEGGYDKHHYAIRDFWEIVHGWGDAGEAGRDKVRRLLEFVTASDRLPVGGVERITFMVQKNGVGDERLPTSLTCFGRLLLPQYSNIDPMRRGLERAIEEAKGFGVA